MTQPMMKTLCEVAMTHVDVPACKTNPLLMRRNRIVQQQIRLVHRAIARLKSVRLDIESLRVDGGDMFEGTGDCEFGHEDVGVTLEWPNLAIMSDEIAQLLREIESSEVLKCWYVFHGDCLNAFFCEAEDRDAAIEQCHEAYPDEPVQAVVPADPHGSLVMEGYGEDPVSCPKCGSRTDFGTLPRDDWQLHVCLRSTCQHSFIAVPDEAEEEDHVA